MAYTDLLYFGYELRLAELTAENKILKSVNDRLLQALPIHGVVRGGVLENESVPRDQVISKKENSELTPNTPTEPLATEALDTGVWDGERCPRCKSVNLVDVDDHWTKCQDCKFRFVGG